jgi:ribonucleotide monophosphatase NagD (HAD superfamily)
VDVALARAQGWDSLLTLTGTTAADDGRPRADAGAPTYVVSRLADAIARP